MGVSSLSHATHRGAKDLGEDRKKILEGTKQAYRNRKEIPLAGSRFQKCATYGTFLKVRSENTAPWCFLRSRMTRLSEVCGNLIVCRGRIISSPTEADDVLFVGEAISLPPVGLYQSIVGVFITLRVAFCWWKFDCYSASKSGEDVGSARFFP